MMRPKLMIPGPVELEAEVLAEMSQPPLAHYGDYWVEVHNETISLLQQIFETSGNVYILPGSGSLAVDTATHSSFFPGDTVIVGRNGWFGERLTEVMVANGLRVIPVESPPNEPLDPNAFRAALQANPNVAGVAFVQLETSTAVLNPIREITAVVHETQPNALLMVDAVTGLAASELKTQAWGIDLCVSASQKALGAPAGLGIVAVSPRALERILTRPDLPRSWYLDLKRWHWFVKNWADWHPFPVTMPTSIVMALRTALHSLMREGVEARIARYDRMSRQLRDGLQDMGMRLFVDESLMAPTITAAYCPEGTTSTAIKNYLLSEHNIQITGGFGAYKEQVIRIGHMGGAVGEKDIAQLLVGLNEFMRQRV